MNGKVSVIVPVYNASGYLGKCVDSILSQTYTDIEIVLVNDCSTDNSAEICQQYKFKFPDKILLIDKPRNEGVDKARFSGLTHVFGSNPEGMVTFVDSDDYIEPEAIERQVTEMIRTGADVVQMQSYRVMGMIRRKSKTFVTPQVIKQPELMEKYFISFFGVNILDVGMWAKLYKVKLIKSSGVAPTGFRMGEDLMFNLHLFPHISCYSIIDYTGYNYRTGGLTSRFNPYLWEDLKEQSLQKTAIAMKHCNQFAVRTTAIELKNVFLSTALQRKEYLKETDDELKAWMTIQLADCKLWHNVRLIADENNEYIYNAIRDNDANFILRHVTAIYKGMRLRRYIKKLISLIFE